jgi:hypothetical protein
VVRTEHLTVEEIEFLRWRAGRWMKLRHLPSVFFHNPLFAARHGTKILGHIFRGVSLKTLFGLENERKAFERYRAIRQAERVCLTRRVILFFDSVGPGRCQVLFFLTGKSIDTRRR